MRPNPSLNADVPHAGLRPRHEAAGKLVSLGVTHHAAGGGCFTTCGSSALMQAQRGADDVQIVIAGLARFGSSKVPTRTKIR